MLNEIVIMGRMTRDPELRTTSNGKSVANFTLAVDRDQNKDVTDFFDCVAWNAVGEFICRNFHKGKLAAVKGSMQSRKWETKDGEKRINWEINVQNVYFAGDKQKQDGYAQMDGGEKSYRVVDPFVDVESRKMEDTYGGGNTFDDDDIPF